MKISVVGLASRTGGGFTVLRDLFEYANNVDSNNQWQFLLSDQELSSASDRVEVLKLAPIYGGIRTRLWVELTSARKAVREYDPDIVLTLQNIDTLARCNKPLAIYMHQALPFQNDFELTMSNIEDMKAKARQAILKRLILISMMRAKVTFVQTTWLAKNLNLELPKAMVFPIGYNSPSVQAVDALTRYVPTGFFYPASPQRYKNFETLHRAIRCMSTDQRQLIGRISITITREQLRSLVIGINEAELDWYEYLGWLDRSEMERMYESSILVFPSLVESLGLPLYEARAKGIRIVAANNSFSREALNDYTRVNWFQSKDEESLAKAMLEAIQTKDQSFLALSDDSHNQNSWGLMLQKLEDLRR